VTSDNCPRRSSGQANRKPTRETEKQSRVAVEFIFCEAARRRGSEMQLKLFVVPIKNVSEAEAEMNGFLRGHRVLAVKKEFVPDGKNSFWTFFVEYLDGTAAATGCTVSGQKVPKVDYKEVLTSEEFELFSRLRDWRNANAEKEGVGDARIDKYGEALLRLLGTPSTSTTP